MSVQVLLLVDIQNGFCPGGELAVPQGDEVVAVANRLIDSRRFQHVIATKDWHPADHLSFADSHPGRKPFEVLQVDGLRQVLWPRHCVAGSASAEFHPALQTERIEKIVYKGTDRKVDSYSGFYDNARRRETDLRGYLEKVAGQHGVKLSEVELSICGLATDYCVAFTARDAREVLGLKVQVVIDGCRAVNLNPGGKGVPSDEVRCLRELAAAGVKLVESGELLAEIGRGGNVSVERRPGRGLELAA